MIKEIDEGLKKHMSDFRGQIMISRGRIHNLEGLSGFVYLYSGEIKGLITYHIENGECEIVSLDSKIEKQGVGSNLIHKVFQKAKERDCTRVWLITSNDNIRAIKFYQKRGFDMIAIHHNAIIEARKIKSTIPLYGFEGIPVCHEIEFEYVIK